MKAARSFVLVIAFLICAIAAAPAGRGEGDHELRRHEARADRTRRVPHGAGFAVRGLFHDAARGEVRRLITPGGPERTLPSLDHREFTLSDTMSKAAGYLASCQTRDGMLQLISSKNRYIFNLAWLKDIPPAPKRSKGGSL
jgi:hypothetical protein